MGALGRRFESCRPDQLYQWIRNNIAYLVVLAGDAPCKVQQGIANDRPEIAQRIIENREKSIGATGFEPAT